MAVCKARGLSVLPSSVLQRVCFSAMPDLSRGAGFRGSVTTEGWLVVEDLERGSFLLWAQIWEG